MRVPSVVTGAALVLVIMSAAACSSGSKSSAASSSTSAPSLSAAGGASASTATSSASTAGSSSVNVCALLTAAQASSIIGVTYTAATSSSGGDVCTYASTVAPIPMTITLTPNAGGTAAWSNELSTLGLDGVAPVAISGVGDRAATSTGSLATQSGSWIIQVDAGDSTSVGDVFTKSIAVAEAIITALH